MNAAASAAAARRELVEANEHAAHYFRSQLLADKGSGPRRYLEARGFAHLLDDTPWTVGYAPGWVDHHPRSSPRAGLHPGRLAGGRPHLHYPPWLDNRPLPRPAHLWDPGP